MPQHPSGRRPLPGRSTRRRSGHLRPVEPTAGSPPPDPTPLRPSDAAPAPPAPQRSAPLTPPADQASPLSEAPLPPAPTPPLASPPPALLLLANRDGSLKEAFADYQDVLALEPPDLTPEWWPSEVEGQPLSPEERALNFQANLEAVLGLRAPAASGSASPTPTSLTPQRVLQSLLLLHSVLHQGPTPTLD